MKLFEGCFEGVSSVALRVVLSVLRLFEVVLRLYRVCFEGCFECLRLFGVLLWGLF